MLLGHCVLNMPNGTITKSLSGSLHWLPSANRLHALKRLSINAVSLSLFLSSLNVVDCTDIYPYYRFFVVFCLRLEHVATYHTPTGYDFRVSNASVGSNALQK